MQRCLFPVLTECLQLAYYPANAAEYVRHRDAFPCDGSEDHQRRVWLPLLLQQSLSASRHMMELPC